METAREKAESWLKHKFPDYNTDQLICLTVLLKLQDRDTRHACAEAVITSERIRDHAKGIAHSIIMNTKAV